MEETWDEDGLYEDEYDDTGAGAGIEGELEMDDDWNQTTMRERDLLWGFMR